MVLHGIIICVELSFVAIYTFSIVFHLSDIVFNLLCTVLSVLSLSLVAVRY